MNATTRDDEYQDRIDLIALWRTLWRHKFLIAACAALCGLIAVVMALTAQPMFKAEAVVAEVRQTNPGGAASMVGQLGGLASLAGLNLFGNGQDREAKAVLQSRRLIEEFIKRNDLLKVLAERTKGKHTLWGAVEYFRHDVVEIREDTRKGVIVVAVEWSDPAIAAHWANGIVELANAMTRDRALAESQRNVDYLNDQLKRTNVVELQRVMYSLIESETKTLMLANGKAEYSFTIVDPAVASELRSKPHRTVMVLVGLAFGLMLGIVAAFVRDFVVRSRAQRVHAQTMHVRS